MKPTITAPALSAATRSTSGRLHAQQHVGARENRGGVGQFRIRVRAVGEMSRRPGAALDQDPGAQGLQLGGDFRNDGDAAFIGSGLPEDAHCDRHAGYLPKR